MSNSTFAQAAVPEEAVGPGRILLVDDEAYVLSALRRLFQSQYHVLVASGGAEGLRVLASEPVDLVISDMRMPGMSGTEFLGRVAEGWPDVIRILLTAHSDLASTVAAINHGHIYKHINKPWRDDELYLTVQRAIELRRLRLERAALIGAVQRQDAELRGLRAGLEQRPEHHAGAGETAQAAFERGKQAMQKSLLDTVGVLSTVIESRIGMSPGHARRVAETAHRLALAMGMNESEAQDVLLAALLRDVGRAALPAATDGDANADTSADTGFAEWARHPLLAEELLHPIEPLRAAATILRHHQERHDGSGFPARLAGDEIPLGARIIALVGDYHALMAGGLTGQALDEQAAEAYLCERRGADYHPQVIDAFITMHGSGGIMLSADRLEPGMKLARDMMSRQGTVLLPRGYRLDEHLIARIRALAADASGSIRICIARD